ncbi:MAG: type II secretion system F family protein [Dehalococcoidales bacterium]|nr:type II secretion system F family protein [Dehalococcoidales bacterium]
MKYAYVAYTKNKKLVKGQLEANSEEAASSLLGYGGYQVLSLKEVVPFFDRNQMFARFNRIKPSEMVMFSRQLALLLESGTDIVTSLELLQDQVTNSSLKKIIAQVISDIRGGSSLSAAMSKHPRAFSQLYYRAMAAGEQGGNPDVVLRQMADHIERETITEKKIRGAMMYPLVVLITAIAVVSLLVAFVLPNFSDLYRAMGSDLPLLPRMLIAFSDWSQKYGLYVLIGIIVAFGGITVYIRTAQGKYRWDRFMLHAPVIGRINLLNQLSRCCRTISLLFRVGIPLPEIIGVAVYSATNKVVAEALTGVQGELLRGEGLSRPMAKRKVFLPLMVQMTSVGEETGNLDKTLATVADSYETESADRTSAAVGMIQPVMTIIIGLIVAFVAIALITAMYSIYDQF